MWKPVEAVENSEHLGLAFFAEVGHKILNGACQSGVVPHLVLDLFDGVNDGGT